MCSIGVVKQNKLYFTFLLAARVLLYASSHRQYNIYHGLCYTSRGMLAGMRNSSMGPPWRIDLMTHRTKSKCFYNRATSCSMYECYSFCWCFGSLCSSGYWSLFACDGLADRLFMVDPFSSTTGVAKAIVLSCL